MSEYKSYLKCVDLDPSCPQLEQTGLCGTAVLVNGININFACQKSCGVCGKLNFI